MQAMRTFLPPAGESTSECADIDNPRWKPLSEGLRRYALARMDKAIAQERHFGAEHLRLQGGICYGMSAAWCRLHEANADAAPWKRMDLLMSESGTTHATLAHRAYAEKSRQLFSNPEARENIGATDAIITSEAALFGLSASEVVTDPLSGEEGYARLAELLNSSGGYYTIPVNFGRDGKPLASHSLNAFAKGEGEAITFYDSNLGEFLVPQEDVPYFINEVSDFYKQTKGVEILGVRSMQKIEFDVPIADTTLAQLASKLC